MKKLFLRTNVLKGIFVVALLTVVAFTGCEKNAAVTLNENVNETITADQSEEEECLADFDVSLGAEGEETFYVYDNECGDNLFYDETLDQDWGESLKLEISGGGETCPSDYYGLPSTFYVFPNGLGTTPYLRVTTTSGFVSGAWAKYNPITKTWSTHPTTGVTITVKTSYTPC